MRIREVMTSSVVTAAPDARVEEVAALMRDRDVGSVVLVRDQGAPCGIVTDRDLAVGVVAQGRPCEEEVEHHASAPVVTAALDMDVEEAAEIMVAHGVRRLPVLDGDRLTGIVTLDDLVLRTGDAELTHRLSIRLAARPEFYFFDRGG